MIGPKQPLIPDKIKDELLSILDSIDPDAAESAFRALINEIESLLRDLGQHKPCDEKTAWSIYDNHKLVLKGQLIKLYPNEPPGLSKVLELSNEAMKLIVSSQRGKTWK
jgi:hypothetical protein